MKCQGLYLGSPCKDSWFEVDRWVIKIMNALNFQERSASCQLQDVKVQAKMSPGEKVLQTE
jgi:hypothetical protein